MQKKVTKKKRTSQAGKSKSKQACKRQKTFNESNCSLLDDNINLNARSISDIFKNEAIKKKNLPNNPTNQINFNSTINNYTSVYTVISSQVPRVRLDKEKVRVNRNKEKGSSVSLGPNVGGNVGRKGVNKEKQRQKSKGKIVGERQKGERKERAEREKGQRERQRKKKIRAKGGSKSNSKSVSKQRSLQKSSKKHQKTKSTLQPQPQPYQVIPQSKQSLNSQIIFSTQQTKRQSSSYHNTTSRHQTHLKQLTQQSLDNNNRLLRSMIKQQYKRKNQAAVKIQKVWRGYLTRKILWKYISEEQDRLLGRLEQYRERQEMDKNQRQQLFDRHSARHQRQFFSGSSFEQSNAEQNRSPGTITSPKTFKDQQSINLSKIYNLNFRQTEEKFFDGENLRKFSNFNKENMVINCEKQLQSEDQDGNSEGDNCEDYLEGSSGSEVLQDGSENQMQRIGSQEDMSSEESQDDIIAYRHHQVIYNSQQIEQFLQQQSSSQDEQYHQLPQIIFETNQEHLQSRKNSVMNKNLSKVEGSNNSLEGKDNYGQRSKDKIIQTNDRQQQRAKYAQNIDTKAQTEQIYKGTSKQTQSQQKVDMDLIKTSKVNSLHSKSHKTSISNQPQFSPSSTSKLCLQQLSQQPPERTSKKQCKKSTKPVPCQKARLQGLVGTVEYKKGKNMMLEINLEDISSSEGGEMGLSDMKNSREGLVIYKNQGMGKVQQESEKSHRQAQPNVQSSKPKEKKSFNKKQIYYFSQSSQPQQVQTKLIKTSQNNFPSNSKDNPLNNPNKNPHHNLQTTLPSSLHHLQLTRWQQIINLIGSASKSMTSSNGHKQEQFNEFIEKVMSLSIKNKHLLKEILAKAQESDSENSTYRSKDNEILSKNSSMKIEDIIYHQHSQKDQEEESLKEFRDKLSSGRRKSVTEQDIAVYKPSSRLVSAKNHSNGKQAYDPKTSQNPSSTQQKPFFFPQSLKQKLSQLQSQPQPNLSVLSTNEFPSLLSTYPTHYIQQILTLRQELLQKRQCQQLSLLNEKLITKKCTQKQFTTQLKQLANKFQQEKKLIDQAREDITKGYHAAVKLMNEAQIQGKKAGITLAKSRSEESWKKKLRNNSTNRLDFTGLQHVVIDELEERVTGRRKSIEARQNLNQKSLPKTQPPSKEPQPQKTQQKRTKVNNITNLIPQLPLASMHLHLPITSIDQTPSQPSSLTNSFLDIIPPCNKPQWSEEESPTYQSLQNNKESRGQDKKSFGQGQKRDMFGHSFEEFGQFSEEDSEEIQFSEEELRRFRKAKPYDPSIVDMNSNVMIGEGFWQMQRANLNSEDQLNEHPQPIKQKDQQHSASQSTKPLTSPDFSQPLRLHLHRQVYQIQQSSPLTSLSSSHYPQNPNIDLLTEKYLEFLIFELSSQILMKPLFSEKFLITKRQEMFGIKRVSDHCRKDFLTIVNRMLPDQNALLKKLNQNISPLPQQLLKCMRIDFTEDDDQCPSNSNDQQEYEQIGKYQMILDQQLCNKAIEQYNQLRIKEKHQNSTIQLLTSNTLDQLKNQFLPLLTLSQLSTHSKIFPYLQQRQTFVTNRLQHCESIRWEFINMELHCLFDAWNEQIIDLKNNRLGFSGIGLNELTLSMIDRNKKIKEDEVKEIMQESRWRLMKLLGYEDDVITEIYTQVIQENHHRHQHQDITSLLLATNPINLPPNESNPNTTQTHQTPHQKSLSQQLNHYHQKHSWLYTPSKEIQEQLDIQQQPKWIYYSDEALSYGLQLVYLIEEELFGQLAKEIRKINIKSQFS